MNVAAAIKDDGPRLHGIHMKDLAKPLLKKSHAAVGDGVMPVQAIFQQLIDQRYPGDLEYDILAGNPMPRIVESFACMRVVLAGMGYK